MTSPATVNPEIPTKRWIRRGFLQRIKGLLLRHAYLLLGSLPRMIDLFYWQTLNMITWGFLNFYITKQSTGIGFVASSILGCAILWDVLVRTQVSVMQPFLEELWSRNVGNIFVSPLSDTEYAVGLIILSLVRTIISMTPCALLAWLLFDLWLPGYGWPMIVFWFNLSMSGWWCGLLLISMLLRFGTSAEWLVWMLAFALSPLVGSFYPIDVLPEAIQHISWLLPPTYVFDGLRALMLRGEIVHSDLIGGFALNLVYLAGAMAVFLATLRRTRRKTGLLQLAE